MISNAITIDTVDMGISIDFNPFLHTVSLFVIASVPVISFSTSLLAAALRERQ